jgi:hypothetical protein
MRFWVDGEHLLDEATAHYVAACYVAAAAARKDGRAAARAAVEEVFADYYDRLFDEQVAANGDFAVMVTGVVEAVAEAFPGEARAEDVWAAFRAAAVEELRAADMTTWENAVRMRQEVEIAYVPGLSERGPDGVRVRTARGEDDALRIIPDAGFEAFLRMLNVPDVGLAADPSRPPLCSAAAALSIAEATPGGLPVIVARVPLRGLLSTDLAAPVRLSGCLHVGILEPGVSVCLTPLGESPDFYSEIELPPAPGDWMVTGGEASVQSLAELDAYFMRGRVSPAAAPPPRFGVSGANVTRDRGG